MKIYRLKVSLMNSLRIYRIIEVAGNTTFEELHDTIFEAFDREEEHLYSFYITRENTKNTWKIYQSQEIIHPENARKPGKKYLSAVKTGINAVNLYEKDYFHYLFDFGDCWWHRVKVEKITESDEKKKYCKIVKKMGESPPQYYYEDEDV